MNDEQFEATMECLRDELADKLRARDTAQREALARLEAERDDIAKSRDQAIADWNQAVDQRDTAQAQLAEALGEIRIYQQKFRYIAEGGSFYLGTAAECVRLTSSFLAMHASTAQAEQQEAQGAQASEFQRESRYIVIKRKDLYAVPFEARERFSVALSQLAKHLPKRECLVVESDWPEYEKAWAAIQARVEGRAALAIQPAVQVNPEPVAHLKVEVLGRITKVDIEWPNGLHTTLPTGKYPLYIVRGAEHE